MPKMATLFTLSLIIISTFVTASSGKFSEQSPETKDAHSVEKVIHLHFYFHDIVSGKHPTAIIVAGKKNVFGMITIIDDPLTEGPDQESKVVGRAQGAYTMSSQEGKALMVIMNLVFTEGEYNGSSISILGSNQFFEVVRELPIVGGSGAFRFARGYAIVKTVKFTLQDVVVEYNVSVMHY